MITINLRCATPGLHWLLAFNRRIRATQRARDRARTPELRSKLTREVDAIFAEWSPREAARLRAVRAFNRRRAANE